MVLGTVAGGSENSDPIQADPTWVVRPDEDGPLVDWPIGLPPAIPVPLDAVVAGRDLVNPRFQGRRRKTGAFSGVGETHHESIGSTG